jgi:hypothetical protein
MVVMSCKKSFLKTVMLVWVLNQLLWESATDFFVAEGVGPQSKIACSVAGVLDEPLSQLTRSAE